MMMKKLIIHTIVVIGIVLFILCKESVSLSVIKKEKEEGKKEKGNGVVENNNNNSNKDNSNNSGKLEEEDKEEGKKEEELEEEEEEEKLEIITDDFNPIHCLDTCEQRFDLPESKAILICKAIEYAYEKDILLSIQDFVNLLNKEEEEEQEEANGKENGLISKVKLFTARNNNVQEQQEQQQQQQQRQQRQQQVEGFNMDGCMSDCDTWLLLSEKKCHIFCDTQLFITSLPMSKILSNQHIINLVQAHEERDALEVSVEVEEEVVEVPTTIVEKIENQENQENQKQQILTSILQEENENENENEIINKENEKEALEKINVGNEILSSVDICQRHCNELLQTKDPTKCQLICNAHEKVLEEPEFILTVQHIANILNDIEEEEQHIYEIEQQQAQQQEEEKQNDEDEDESKKKSYLSALKNDNNNNNNNNKLNIKINSMSMTESYQMCLNHCSTVLQFEESKCITICKAHEGIAMHKELTLTPQHIVNLVDDEEEKEHLATLAEQEEDKEQEDNNTEENNTDLPASKNFVQHSVFGMEEQHLVFDMEECMANCETWVQGPDTKLKCQAFCHENNSKQSLLGINVVNASDNKKMNNLRGGVIVKM